MVFEIRHSGAEHSEPMRYRHMGQYLEGREAWLEGGLRVPEIWHKMVPLSGIPLKRTLSYADTLSVTTMRRVHSLT